MDFMVSLPPSRGFDAIMVVVDWFSKMTHFIPTKESAMAQKMGRLFFTHVFKHHGLPTDIVSDRDPKFTSKFWWTLWKRTRSEFKMSTSFQPKKFRYGRIGNKRPFLCRLFLYILFPLIINFFLKPFINCWMICIKMFLQTCYAICFIICY